MQNDKPKRKGAERKIRGERLREMYKQIDTTRKPFREIAEEFGICREQIYEYLERRLEYEYEDGLIERDPLPTDTPAVADKEPDEQAPRRSQALVTLSEDSSTGRASFKFGRVP